MHAAMHALTHVAAITIGAVWLVSLMWLGGLVLREQRRQKRIKGFVAAVNRERRTNQARASE